MTLKVLDEDIRIIDIKTPTFYSVNFRRGFYRYYVLLQDIGSGKYLIRQILQVNPKVPAATDKSFDEKVISFVKEEIKGFTSPTNTITLYEVLAGVRGG